MSRPFLIPQILNRITLAFYQLLLILRKKAPYRYQVVKLYRRLEFCKKIICHE